MTDDEILNRVKSYQDAKLNRVTKTIKIFPFVYTLALLVLSPLEAWLTLKWAEVLGLLVFTSVPSAWLCWRLSNIVGLCRWYRAQCVFMLSPVAIPLFRICNNGGEVVWVWIGVVALLAVSLVNCYFVFVKPSVKDGR